MTFEAVNGLRYFVYEAGEGPPLVLLHGFTGSSASWAPVMSALAAHHHVLAIDLPGHGQTGAPDYPARYSMPAVSADIERLLDSRGIRRADLLGYSMGGRLALYMALRLPTLWRSLVLESASPGLAQAEARRERVAADNALAGWLESQPIAVFVERWENLPLFASQRSLPKTQQAVQREQRLANRPSGLARSLRGMGTGQQPSLWGELSRLRVPTLLLAGALDSKFAAINKEMVSAIRQARLILVPETGHTIHLERPEAFSRHVLSFLAGGEHEGTQNLAGAEQDDECQSGQRHLLEPGIEAGQVGRPADGQPVANQQRHSEQKQVLPEGTGGHYHVKDSHQNRQD